MGRRIDRTVAAMVLAIGYYLFFLNAWDSIPLACGAAFVACALTRRLLRAVPIRRRVSRAQAWAELMRIATLSDKEAEEAIAALVERRYPGEVERIAVVLKHPEASATSGDILNAWKANRDAQRLVIAASCPCEPRAMLFARELKSPIVAVIDSRRLTRMLCRQPAQSIPEAPRPSLRLRLHRLMEAVASTRITPRNALLSVVLLAAYLLTGNAWCLFPALALIAHLSIALSQRRFGQKRLFDNAI